MLAALCFLAPNLLGFLVFTAFPVVFSLGMSFTNWSLKPTVVTRFVGLRNYVDLFSDRHFWFYLYNTVYFMLGIPIGIAGSLLLAIFLSQPLTVASSRSRFVLGGAMGCMGLLAVLFLVIAGRVELALWVGILFSATLVGILTGKVGFRTLFYLPNFTAGVAVFLLWMQLYNPHFGLINGMLSRILHVLGMGHVELPAWLSSTRSLLGFLPLPESFNCTGVGLGAREAIMIMGIWLGVGGNDMLLYLAGLSNIPLELYESAQIDGAGVWARFCHITWPQLAPTTFFIVVMSTIGGLQGGFEMARVMTEGGPAGTTTTLSYYIYTVGFERLDMGYASSISWFLFLIILGLTLINWKFGNRYVGIS